MGLEKLRKAVLAGLLGPSENADIIPSLVCF